MISSALKDLDSTFWKHLHMCPAVIAFRRCLVYLFQADLVRNKSDSHSSNQLASFVHNWLVAEVYFYISDFFGVFFT